MMRRGTTIYKAPHVEFRGYPSCATGHAFASIECSDDEEKISVFLTIPQAVALKAQLDAAVEAFRANGDITEAPE